LRDLTAGDLICLSAEDWADGWRGRIGIVLSFYDTRRVKSYHTGKTITVRRWKVLVDNETIVTVINDDVTLLQGASSEQN
jgi:hypothetical protein